MLNKVTLQQSADPDWTTGKCIAIWKQICKEENPEDEMAEMDMEDELQEIRLGKDRNPREILRDMAAIETKYKLTINASKKAAFVLRIGRNKYKTSMATTENNARNRNSRKATAKELVEEMYREWQIGGGKPSKLCNNDSTRKVEMVLASQTIPKKVCYNFGSDKHVRNKCPHLNCGNSPNGNSDAHKK